MNENSNNGDGYYMQSQWLSPACNHFDAEPDGTVLMYAQGITTEGVPFEAEQWENTISKNVTFVLPVIEYLEEEAANDKKENSIVNDGDLLRYHLKKENQLRTVLTQGMVECDEQPSDQSLMNYVDYLVSAGLIHFAQNVYNGSAEYLIDREGKQVLTIIICLMEEDVIHGDCSLEFHAFPDFGYKKTPVLKRIK